MLLIRNGTLINPGLSQEGSYDILTAGGRILAIRPELDGELALRLARAEGLPPEDLEVLDARGLYVLPGLIDTHAHFRDPGFTYKEDLFSGAAAAARGGYTTVILMANTKPAVDTAERLRAIQERAASAPIRLLQAANVTRDMAGRELADLPALAEAGAPCFTDDGLPVMDPDILRAALRAASPLGLPVSLHEEDPALIAQNGIHGGGRAAAHYGIGGSPREAEYTMIRRDLAIAVEEKARLVIQHISTKEGVEAVRQARKVNPLIHAEATPHHFSLTEEAVIEKGTLAKVNPPIRTEEDRMAIIEGMKDGTIDIIATDHAPHASYEKERPLTQAPSGMIGLETALSLAYRNLVLPGHLTLMEMTALFTSNPAAYYHLEGGVIREGAPADFCLFSPDSQWKVPETFASRSSNSPFIGEVLPGLVAFTICGGKVVCRAEAH